MSERIIPIKNLHVGLVETLQGANGYLQILKKRKKQSGCGCGFGGGERERENRSRSRSRSRKRSEREEILEEGERIRTKSG